MNQFQVPQLLINTLVPMENESNIGRPTICIHRLFLDKLYNKKIKSQCPIFKFSQYLNLVREGETIQGKQ